LLVADRFDSPVGTQAERGSGFVPPGDWYSHNNYGNYYQLKPGVFAYHTGADLVLWPGGGAHEPISATANGLVTFAKRVPNSTWGNVIVVGHTLDDGSEVYSRYGHVEEMLVKAGDEVQRGDRIASEGNAFGQFAFHLHFDISPTKRLLQYPQDWPGLDRERLRRDYVDPLVFIQNNREVITLATLAELKAVRAQAAAVVASLDTLIGALAFEPNYFTTAWLKVRTKPVDGDVITTLAPNTGVLVMEAESVAGWKKISQPNVGFCSEVYLTPKT
jgi:murein DD-endopeptidase MepM/ murein hydrolase activator NlpD